MANLNDVLHIKNQLLKSKNKEINALRVKVKELTKALEVEAAGSSCCEEAELTANELARRNEELSEAQDKIAALKRMTARMADERNRNVEAKFEALAERDELQARLDAAEGWPEWLGPALTREELGEIEVTKSSRGYWAQGVRVAELETKPEDLRQSNIVNDSISSRIRREAVARFIESEQAEADDEDQRVEEQAKALLKVLYPMLPWRNLSAPTQDVYRDAIRAGWTPPESEDEK